MQTCTICSKEFKNLGVHSRVHKTDNVPEKVKSEIIEEKKPETDVSVLVAKIEALEKRDEENQAKMKLLYEVADKGRVLNYENKQAGKQPMKVKLGVWNAGIIVGWRTTKDNLIKHPTTGLTVGEEQQFEILLLDKEGQTNKILIDGYPAFSNARYSQRIEVEVVGKKEDWDGNMTFDVILPDGRPLSLDSRFVN